MAFIIEAYARASVVIEMARVARRYTASRRGKAAEARCRRGGDTREQQRSLGMS